MGLLDTQDLSGFGLLKAASFSKPYDSRDAAIALHRTADSSLASPGKARLRTSLGMTTVCRAPISCTLALLRPHWHGKDSGFLARLAEQGSASDFIRNDKGLPRSRFLGGAAAALARQGTADSSFASPSKARLRTSLGMTRVCRALVFCTLALLRPQWHGKDSRFLARLAEQSSASDFTRNDKGFLSASRCFYFSASRPLSFRTGR